MRRLTLFLTVLVLTLFAVFAPVTSAELANAARQDVDPVLSYFTHLGGSGSDDGIGEFSGTYSGSGVTIHLAQSGSALSGTFDSGGLAGNMGGFVDSSGRAYAWAWWDSTSSGAVAGRLTLSGSQGTFSFGGGQSPGGRIGEIALSGMTKSSLSGSTTVTTGSNTTNYAGTYSTAGLTITLTQSGSILSGTFSSGNLSGTVGGFVDSSGRAYVWAYWDSSGGSGVVAGGLSVSGTQGTFSFGGGQSSEGLLAPIDQMQLQRSSTTTGGGGTVSSTTTGGGGTVSSTTTGGGGTVSPTNITGTYIGSGYLSGATCHITQSGSNVSASCVEEGIQYQITGTISGTTITYSASGGSCSFNGTATVSGNRIYVDWPSSYSAGCSW